MSATAEQAVGRGRSAKGLGMGYCLGSGGRHPEAPHPGGPHRKEPMKPGLWCDCSGFLPWCWGLDRRQFLPNGKEYWLGVDQMIADANGPAHFLLRIRAANVRPGDGVMFPSKYLFGVRISVGHCALVTKVGTGTVGSPAWWSSMHILDCSSSNWKHHGDAIRERYASSGKLIGRLFMRSETVFVRSLRS